MKLASSTRAARAALPAAAAAFALALALPAPGAEKRPAPEADLGPKRQTAPDGSLAGTLDGRKAATSAGPRLAFDQFRFAVELQVSGKRREEMGDLEKLIRLGGSASELPGWIFRLAELHWEEAQYFFFEANRRDDQLAALGEKPDPAAVERLRAEKREMESRSRAQQEEAIQRYREIARRWPDYPRLDEVVFFLGENLWKQQRRPEALEAYKALISRFPKSRYVPDAWMAFGEHYFDSAEKGSRNENLAKALETYRRAASHPESSIYGYALYKQGWVHYNLGRWNEALELFRGVILFGELPTTTIAPEKKIALVREARRDYVRTYSHIGEPQAALEDFKRVGGDAAWAEMLKSLAGLYYDDGKDREAVLVYRQLIQLAPVSPEAPLYQSRIVTAAGRLGRKDLAVQQAKIFVRMLRAAEQAAGAAEAGGAARDEKGRQALAAARADAENTLRTLAVTYHNEYRKTRDDPVAALAADVYASYLEVFPEAPQLYQMRFFHAELLFSIDRYQEAGDEYARVAQIDAARAAQRPPAPGKYFTDALESAVHSYDLVGRRAEGAVKPEARGAPEARQRQPIPLPKEKQQLADACEAYLRWQPHGAKAVEIAYKAADVYYRHNRFAEAVKLYSAVALEHPRHEVAAYAANLVLDCFNLQGDWRSMNSWAQRFWHEAELLRAHPTLRDDLARVIEQSAFKVVEELERGRRYAEAAAAYLAFARDWPASGLAATALYNAAVDLSLSGEIERALEVREQLLARYPGDPLTPKVIFSAAADREAAGDFEKAALAYERYYAEWKGQRTAPGRAKSGTAAKPEDAAPYEAQKAQDALFNAGVLREGLSQYRKAEADRLAFVESWPAAPEARKVFLSLADLAARDGSPAREVARLEEYRSRYGAAPDEWLAVQARIARVQERAGNREAARKARSAALAFYRQRKLTPEQAGERGMPAVAEGLLIELEPAFASWDRITLDVKPRYLKSQLEAKGKKLQELEKQYGAVVQLKQAEPAVCALYRIGLLYQHFARMLVDAPVPKELRGNQELVQEYRAQLASLAEAPQEKAVEGMEIAAAKSRELGVQNECSRDAEAMLAKAKPDRHGPMLEKLPELSAPAAARERAPGYGLLAAPKDWEAARRAAAAGASARPPAPLPPLSSAGGAAPGRSAAQAPGREEPPSADDRPPGAAVKRPPADDRPPVLQSGERADDDEDLPK